MDNKNTISEELKDLCPVVANISRKNIYTVPSGYFEAFSENLFTSIDQEEQSILPKSLPNFKTPEGYFESLPALILAKAKLGQEQKSELEDELEAIAPLLNNISRSLPYTVPLNYFEGLEAMTVASQQPAISETEEELQLIAPSLIEIRNINVYSLPDGYLENFCVDVSNVYVTSEIERELESISPLLNTIDKKPLYFVPSNYFESFKVSVEVKEQKLGIVRSLFFKTSAITRYAAAAVIGVILFAGGIFYFDGGHQQNGGGSTAYKTEQIKTLSNEEIEDYLNSYSSPADVSSTNVITTDEDDLKSFLKDMSQEEIEEYLKENTEPNEVHSKEG